MKKARRPIAVLLYRGVLRLYPSGLRREFGDEMSDLVERQWSRARAARRGRIVLGRRIARDVLSSLPREHWRAFEARRAEARRLRAALETRRSTGDSPMSAFFQDLRYALRTLTQQPLVSLLVVGMLGLGIAGNAVIFSLLDGMLLRPLPFDDSGRLVYLDETAPKWGLERVSITFPDFHAWREQNRTFASMAAIQTTNFNLATGDRPERARGALVTFEMPEVLRLEPVLGRFFTAEEDRPGAPDLAVVGHDLWQRQFGGRKDVLGSVLRLDGVPYTVIGVLPPEGRFPNDVELWTALRADPNEPSSYYLKAAGRLDPDVTLTEALVDLETIQRRRIDAEEASEAVMPVLGPLRDQFVDDTKPYLWALMASVIFVLAIACANVACVMLARGTSRARELGIRAALGAGRFRLVRQMLTESLVLALAGGVFGSLLAVWGYRALVASQGDRLQFWAMPQLDARVIAFGAAVCVGTALLFGLVPALRTSRDAVFGVLGSASRGPATHGGQRRSLQALIVVEMALALVLLVGASLLVRSFVALRHVDPGFRTDNVLTFYLSLPESQYEEEAVLGFYSGLRDKLAALPGVTAASAVSLPPFGGHSGYFFEAETPTRPEDPDGKTPVVLVRVAMPGYFDAMGVTLLGGRTFTEEDVDTENGRVLVVNESFAGHFWPGAQAIGQHVRFRGSDGPWMTVVGVNRDVLHYGLDRPMRPGAYVPLAQAPQRMMAMVLHAAVDAGSLVEPARAAVAELDPQLPLFRVATMEEQLERSLKTRAMMGWLVALFAAVALVLAAGGIYGVVSYAVGRRTREIGIRMALGARAAEVRRLVLGQGARLAVSGVALGIVLALLLARGMTSVLYGVSATDPWTLAAVASALVAIAILANLVPAARASRIAPMSALREE